VDGAFIPSSFNLSCIRRSACALIYASLSPLLVISEDDIDELDLYDDVSLLPPLVISEDDIDEPGLYDDVSLVISEDDIDELGLCDDAL